jgi:tetratricopeptide (TPR) repeat protein
MEMYGLDKKGADYLHRGEVLQERGQLELALEYYRRLLQDYSDCEKARDDARFTAETLLQRMEEASLPGDNVYTVTEMYVRWTGRYYIPQIGGDPSYNEDAMAEEAATKELPERGYKNFLLRLVSNKITKRDDGPGVGSQDMNGIAHFKVTLKAGSNTAPVMTSLKTFLDELNNNNSVEEHLEEISLPHRNDDHEPDPDTHISSSRFEDASEV